MAAPPPTAPTAASVQFRNLTANDLVVNPNFNRQDALRRALKVFVMSYPELSDNSPVLYKQKFDEFVRSISILYNVPPTNLGNILNGVYTAVATERYQIVISAKRFKGRDQMKKPKFFVKILTQNNERALDENNELQPYNPIRIGSSFQMFTGFRQNPIPQKIVMSIGGKDWLQSDQPLNEFDFIIANTSSEGFEEWIDFGRGVQLLINVEYKVVNERNITPQDISDFHFHTILMMIGRRLKAFRKAKADRDVWTVSGHREVAFRSRVTYRKPYINPQTNEMFWSDPTRNRPSAVKYTDIQIGYLSNENLMDSVCLCSEWCNWNAFFYYNPIYRFLLVRHSQLFMQNPSNVPDMYLCLSILNACFPVPAPNETPILYLMKSANDYVNKYYDNFALKNTMFAHQYSTAFPARDVLNGLSYNRLRFNLDITKLIHQLDRNPFTDESIEALKGYFKVLTDLHVYHSRRPLHVPIARKKVWFKEMDALSRHQYGTYFKMSYDLCIATLPGGYDYLFTTDHQYADRALSEVDVYIKRIRDNVTKKVQTDNPFNFKVISNDFLNTFSLIYKFLAKVEPYLPSLHKETGRRNLFTGYMIFDSDFTQYQTTSGKSLNFRFDANSTGFPNLEKHFTVFYTLKLYSYLFEIQKHCSNSVLKFNRLFPRPGLLAQDAFDFIWKNSIIEHKYRTVFPGEILFDIKPEIAQYFEDFYIQFWGRARHEITIPLPSFLHVIDSGHFQYQRLYYWERRKGNNKRKFTKILEVFNASFTDVINRSEDIFNRWIIPAISQLSQNYSYDLEVFDYLVYYLTKADCSLILSTTATLIRQTLKIRIAFLAQNGMSYTLCKPGWIPIIRSIHSVLGKIDRIRTNYIVFDDEFNRISNVCTETKKIIKDIYRQFYAKLSSEWLAELDGVYRTVTVVNQNAKEFIGIHIAVGLAFISTFYKDFPKDYQNMRRLCIWLMKSSPVNPGLPHQVALFNALTVVEDYLKDRTLVEEAEPFEAALWTSFMTNTFGQFDRLTSAQVRIDMTAANQ